MEFESVSEFVLTVEWLLIFSLSLSISMKTTYKDSINQVIAELSSSQREKLMVLVKENKLTSLLA